MKRILRTVGILLLCGAFLLPESVSAQSRGRNSNPSATKQQATPNQSLRQSTGRTGGNTQSSRPGSYTRPGAGQQPGGQQPGSQPGVQRPGNQPGNQPGVQRPENPPGNNPGNRPPSGGPGGSFGGQRPNYQPAPPPPPRPGMGPARPNMPPAPYSWYRPAPPPAWRPPSAWRAFNSILGVALGASINATINSLINSGYRVSQYGTGSVCAYNVPMLNFIWPDAVLYYNSLGGLCGSRFIYTSSFYDMNRYNSVYATLVSIYGSPYSVQNSANGIEASWWGINNQYISLSFTSQYNSFGQAAYYTTLSYGN